SVVCRFGILLLGMDPWHLSEFLLEIGSILLADGAHLFVASHLGHQDGRGKVGRSVLGAPDQPTFASLRRPAKVTPGVCLLDQVRIVADQGSRLATRQHFALLEAEAPHRSQRSQPLAPPRGRVRLTCILYYRQAVPMCG